MEDAKPNTPDPAKPEGSVDGKPDEVLAVLNEVLKRDFKTRDEAVKSVDNLKNMVGDNAIAELREKAKDADLFAKVVGNYAKAEGLTNEDSRKALLQEAMDQAPVTKQEEQKPQAVNPELERKLDEALVRLQEKELLEAHPNAKLVLNDVKALRAANPGKELKEIYEASSLKDMVAKAVTYETEKAAKESTAVDTSPRQADLKADQFKDLVAKAQSTGMMDDKAALVAEFFKAQTK